MTMLRLQLPLQRQLMIDCYGFVPLVTPPLSRPPFNPLPPKLPFSPPPPPSYLKLKTSVPHRTSWSRVLCKLKDSGYTVLSVWPWELRVGALMPMLQQDVLAEGITGDCITLTLQLELGKPIEKHKPEKHVNGIFWIILINLGIYIADHIFQVRGVKALYLYHNHPAWYQFVTATFCHFNWNHLSSNLFFLYIFGKLVEEEEGNFGLWFSYLLTGAGANLVSWLVLPRNAVSIGSSGAVFGLFAISVLVKMSWDWRKILEALILGQFVVERVMEAAQASTALTGGFNGGYALQSVNHVAHLSGALIGVVLIWLLSGFSSQPIETHTGKNKR